MEKKYQIFISSTYKDLIQEREMVLKTILTMYHIPIGMELFSAADEDQWQIIQDTIDYSDYYILILGHRYGSVDNSGIGFTEKEYDYALHKKIPILSFVLDDKATRTSEQRETDSIQLQKFNNFREKVLKNSKMSEFWNQPDELGRKVAIALPKTFIRTPSIGWVRSDNAASPEVLEEIALLSKENRDLRNQLTSLLNETTRRPELKCILKPVEIIFLKMLDLNFPDIINEITLQDIPIDIQKYLSDTEIEDYNNSINFKKETITDYNSKSIRYNRLENQQYNISFNIQNNGTLKAHSIYIYLYFPDDLVIIENSDKLKNDKPDIPIDPSLYPLYIAKQRAEADKKKLVFTSPHSSNFRNYSPGLMSPRFSPVLHRDLLSPRKNWLSVDYNTNSIKIHITELLHNMKFSFDEEISIVPFSSGDFLIKGDIICEEYATKEDFSFAITVPVK